MTGGWIALLLDLSGKITFACLAIWVVLRVLAYFGHLLGPVAPNFFPVSAQRLGFAQGLGERSVIVSEADYHVRSLSRGFIQKLATSWWPLVAWGSLTQFVILFGARGLANELEIPFWLGLGMSASAFLSLGFFRRRMVGDHLRESNLPEGREIEWDAEAYLGGLRIRIRFEGRARKVVLSRLERNAIAKDHANEFHFHGMIAQPDSAHRHGSGLIYSEFRMLDAADEKLSEESWLKKIKLRDALNAVLGAYVLSNERKMPVVALVEYPGAVLMVTPLAEHIEFLEAVGERLRKRKKAPSMTVRDIALAAAQEFPSRFDDLKIAELMAHKDWVSKENMPI
jgi:hypothetical protein